MADHWGHCEVAHVLCITLSVPLLSYMDYAFLIYYWCPVIPFPASPVDSWWPVGGILISWAASDISHIPIHLVLIAYNIAQCYTTYQMPPTFSQ